jgi:hypothetical protein
MAGGCESNGARRGSPAEEIGIPRGRQGEEKQGGEEHTYRQQVSDAHTNDAYRCWRCLFAACGLCLIRRMVCCCWESGFGSSFLPAAAVAAAAGAGADAEAAAADSFLSDMARVCARRRRRCGQRTERTEEQRRGEQSRGNLCVQCARRQPNGGRGKARQGRQTEGRRQNRSGRAERAQWDRAAQCTARGTVCLSVGSAAWVE